MCESVCVCAHARVYMCMHVFASIRAYACAHAWCVHAYTRACL